MSRYIIDTITKIFLLLLISAIAVAVVPLVAQERLKANSSKYTRTITYTQRVDVSNPTINAILHRWIAYLESRPDSLYDNGYWSVLERQRLVEFDLTRNWVFQSHEFLDKYTPTILSIEPSAGKYIIRTMFTNTTISNDTSVAVAPVALHSVYATFQSDEWYFEGAFTNNISSWEQTRIGSLVFRYPPNISFSLQLARHVSHWCDSVARVFDISPLPEAMIIVTRNRDELAYILGLDYFVAPPIGLTYQRDRIMLSAIGTPWYPHELTHIIFSDFHKAHPLLREGIATYIGGSLGESPQAMMRNCANRYRITPFSLDSLLCNPERLSNDYYSIGAVLCNIAYKKGGAEAVRELLSPAMDSHELYQLLTKLFGWQQNSVSDEISKILKEL